MSKIRQSARDKPCQVRLIGICNGNPETTVLAHFRDLSLGSGVGLKTADLFGAFCCSSCHDYLDGRAKTFYTKEDLRMAHMIGVLRTQKILLDEGLIKL